MRSFFEFDQYGYLMRVTDLILNQDIAQPSNYGLLHRKIYIIVNFFSWGRINTNFVFIKFSYNKLESKNYIKIRRSLFMLGMITEESRL